jgi:membrane protein DedA with SNARE-associated domain
MIHVKQQMIDTLSQLEGWTAYSAIVGLLVICGLGVPLPEDITLAAAGIISALGSITIFGAIAAGFIGVMAGDAFLYTVGRVYGRRAFALPLIRVIMTPRRIALAERKLMRNSKFICFTARFLPGLRSPIFLMAGIMGVRPVVFYGLDGLAALISVPLWVIIGHFVGENIDVALKVVERVQLSLLAIVVATVASYVGYRRFRKVRRAQRLMYFMNSRYNA